MKNQKNDMPVKNEKNDTENIIMNQYERLSQRNAYVSNAERSIFQEINQQISVQKSV